MQEKAHHNSIKIKALGQDELSPALSSKLDMALIAKKQKDPHEWERFLQKGRMLNLLFKKLQEG